MKEKVICYIMIYGCYGLFCSLELLRFFKSELFKFAEKSDGERVKGLYYNERKTGGLLAKCEIFLHFCKSGVSECECSHCV